VSLEGKAARRSLEKTGPMRAPGAVLVLVASACAAGPVRPVEPPVTTEPRLEWRKEEGLIVCGETRIRIPDFLRPNVKQPKPDEIELVLSPAHGLGALVVKARGQAAPQGDRFRERQRLEKLVAPDATFEHFGSLLRAGRVPIEYEVAKAGPTTNLDGDKRYRLVSGVSRNPSISCHLSAIEQLLPNTDIGPGLLALVDDIVEQSEREAEQQELRSAWERQKLREAGALIEGLLQVAGVFLYLLEPFIK
jgi:hypothetical protein